MGVANSNTMRELARIGCRCVLLLTLIGACCNGRDGETAMERRKAMIHRGSESISIRSPIRRSGLASSLSQCAICDDIISWIKHYLPGLEVNTETLQLDLIEES